MKYTEIAQKTASETIAYIVRTAKGAAKGKTQKSLAMAIYHLAHCGEEGNEFWGEAGLTSLFKTAKKRWDIDLRNGSGVQGTYECLRVFTALKEEGLDTTEARFLTSPLSCNLMLSSFLNDESVKSRIPEIMEAYNKGKGAYKAMKEIKDSLKPVKPATTPTEPKDGGKPGPKTTEGAENPETTSVSNSSPKAEGETSKAMPLPEAAQAIFDEIAKAESEGDVEHLLELKAWFMQCAESCDSKALTLATAKAA